LADGHDLLAGDTEFRYSSKDLLANGGCGLVLGKNIWVLKRVVYTTTKYLVSSNTEDIPTETYQDNVLVGAGWFLVLFLYTQGEALGLTLEWLKEKSYGELESCTNRRPSLQTC
jgi:hypothetical protein